MHAASRVAHRRLAAVAAHLHPSAAAAAAPLGRGSVAWHCHAWQPLRPLRSSALVASQSFEVAPTGRVAQQRKQPLLPPQSAKDKGRLVVVLDMDETLLHSSLTPFPLGADPRSVDDHLDAQARRQPNRKKPEHSFTIGTGAKDQERVRSIMRPGLRQFLLAISAEFEPILFTSALSIYAKPLLDLVEGPAPGDASVTVPGEAPIPPELHPVFRHRRYREATVPALELQYDYVKDVRLLGRDMSRVILVDNSAHACLHSPDNCIVVPDFLGDSTDRVFEPLLKLLREADKYEDVRPFLRAKMGFRKQLEKQGFKFPGMEPQGKDITLEEENKEGKQ